MTPACGDADCIARLSVIEAALGPIRSTAEGAAHDVATLRRDVDKLESDVLRLRAVLVGEGAEERGGIRAQVQALVIQMEDAKRQNKWVIRLLFALVAVLSPEQLVKLAHLVQKVVAP